MFVALSKLGDVRSEVEFDPLSSTSGAEDLGTGVSFDASHLLVPPLFVFDWEGNRDRDLQMRAKVPGMQLDRRGNS